MYLCYVNSERAVLCAGTFYVCDGSGHAGFGGVRLELKTPVAVLCVWAGVVFRRHGDPESYALFRVLYFGRSVRSLRCLVLSDSGWRAYSRTKASLIYSSCVVSNSAKI